MTAIIKIKPVHVKYLLSEEDININLNSVPPAYRLPKRSLCIVNRYADTTYQWVLLTDGRKVRTRSLKADWRQYVPSVAEARAAVERWNSLPIASVPMMNRVVLNGPSKYSSDETIHLRWNRGFIIITTVIKGTKSRMTWETESVGDYEIAVKVVEFLQCYRIYN